VSWSCTRVNRGDLKSKFVSTQCCALRQQRFSPFNETRTFTHDSSEKKSAKRLVTKPITCSRTSARPYTSRTPAPSRSRLHGHGRAQRQSFTAGGAQLAAALQPRAPGRHRLPLDFACRPGHRALRRRFLWPPTRSISTPENIVKPRPSARRLQRLWFRPSGRWAR